MTEAEQLAEEVSRRVFALGLAYAEGDEDRWDSLVASTPSELSGAVFRAMCAAMVGMYEDLAVALHQVPDPKAYVIEGFRQELENTGG